MRDDQIDQQPAEREIPRIVSVDDHVIEPPHVFERWLPTGLRERGPRVERRGIARTTFHGGSDYRFEFADDAPPASAIAARSAA